jgi:hypothetical protein
VRDPALAAEVAGALTGIHGAGLLHRDLTPRNVVLPPGIGNGGATVTVVEVGIASMKVFEVAIAGIRERVREPRSRGSLNSVAAFAQSLDCFWRHRAAAYARICDPGRAELFRFLGAVLAAYSLALILLLAALAHRPAAPAFILLLVAVARCFGRRSETDDVLAAARQPLSAVAGRRSERR